MVRDTGLLIIDCLNWDDWDAWDYLDWMNDLICYASKTGIERNRTLNYKCIDKTENSSSQNNFSLRKFRNVFSYPINASSDDKRMNSKFVVK